MRIKFWGTRGSIPTPEPSHMKYGGDTSCVALSSGSTLVILDAGTGLRRLGAQLVKSKDFSGTGYVFLSHSHWDHIQGFPFFAPAFVKDYEFTIHGAFKADKRLQEALRDQMGSIYFPVSMQELPSSLRFVDLLEQDIIAGDMLIRSKALNHPGGCFGYRITDGSSVIAYCTDTEHSEEGLDPKVLELAENADVFVYDAQFTPHEYHTSKRGWGHSTWQEGVRLAQEAGVRRLVLFHHDPWHDDVTIDEIEREARIYFPSTVAAHRDMEIDLGTCTISDAETIFRDMVRTSGIPVHHLNKKTSSLRIQITHSAQGTMVIKVPHDLSLFNSDSFKHQVLDAISSETTQRLIFDFKDLAFIDSAGIGSLVSLGDWCRQHGVEMRLCHVSPRINEILVITRINLVMKVFSTLNDARDTA